MSRLTSQGHTRSLIPPTRIGKISSNVVGVTLESQYKEELELEVLLSVAKHGYKVIPFLDDSDTLSTDVIMFGRDYHGPGELYTKCLPTDQNVHYFNTVVISFIVLCGIFGMWIGLKEWSMALITFIALIFFVFKFFDGFYLWSHYILEEYKLIDDTKTNTIL